MPRPARSLADAAHRRNQLGGAARRTHAGRKQIVVNSPRKVRSYDYETGKQIWEAAGLGTNTIPRAVQHQDLVLVMSGFRNPQLMAIRLGREGDLAGTDAIVWRTNRGLSYTASPVLLEGKLYFITDTAMVQRRRRGDGTAGVSAGATAETLQHQSVACRRRGTAVLSDGRRRRHRGEDRADVRHPGDEHAHRSVVHRLAGRWRMATCICAAGRTSSESPRRSRRGHASPRSAGVLHGIFSGGGHIVAMGGGGFMMEPDNSRLDDFVLSLARRQPARVCFMPTASADSATPIVRFYRAFSGRSVRPGARTSFASAWRMPASPDTLRMTVQRCISSESSNRR